MAKKEDRTDVRINKYISESGFCSRRDADKLVADERVTINGVVATPGSRVAEGDKVKIDGEPLHYIPMEQREYKLRRYGSSRRRAESVAEERPNRSSRERAAAPSEEARRGGHKALKATKKGDDARRSGPPARPHSQAVHSARRGVGRGKNTEPSQGRSVASRPDTKRRKG